MNEKTVSDFKKILEKISQKYSEKYKIDFYEGANVISVLCYKKDKHDTIVIKIIAKNNNIEGPYDYFVYLNKDELIKNYDMTGFEVKKICDIITGKYFDIHPLD